MIVMVQCNWGLVEIGRNSRFILIALNFKLDCCFPDFMKRNKWNIFICIYKYSLNLIHNKKNIKMEFVAAHVNL